MTSDTTCLAEMAIVERLASVGIVADLPSLGALTPVQQAALIALLETHERFVVVVATTQNALIEYVDGVLTPSRERTHLRLLSPATNEPEVPSG